MARRTARARPRTLKNENLIAVVLLLAIVGMTIGTALGVSLAPADRVGGAFTTVASAFSCERFTGYAICTDADGRSRALFDSCASRTVATGIDENGQRIAVACVTGMSCVRGACVPA